MGAGGPGDGDDGGDEDELSHWLRLAGGSEGGAGCTSEGASEGGDEGSDEGRGEQRAGAGGGRGPGAGGGAPTPFTLRLGLQGAGVRAYVALVRAVLGSKAVRTAALGGGVRTWEEDWWGEGGRGRE